jgi:hypothetical protein
MLDVEITDAGYLMRQAWMTADDYMMNAVERIDRQFGEGYAKKHPELVGAFMRTAAADYHSALMKAASQDIRDEIRDIRGVLTKRWERCPKD